MVNKTLAASLKAASDGMRKRDVIDVANAVLVEPKLAPTPEQKARVEYVRGGTKVEKGHPTASAYRRLPLFETLAKQGNRIDGAGLAALRFYREAHDAQDASPTRCALNDEGRGGGLPLCIPFSIAGMMLDDLHGGTLVDMIERQLGNTVATMQAVALEDQSFSAIAIARFGSRKVGWIEQEERRGRARDAQGRLAPIERFTIGKDGKLKPRKMQAAYVEKVVPISGRHREIVAEEFARGLELLKAAHAPYVSTARPHPFQVAGPPITPAEVALAAVVAPAAPVPPVDQAFLNESGHMRPMAEIADIIRERVSLQSD